MLKFKAKSLIKKNLQKLSEKFARQFEASSAVSANC